MRNPMGDCTLRVCHFRPYLAGKGPGFTLTTWDTCRTDLRGQTIIGYALHEMRTGRVIFRGEDFAGSPLCADDSDDTVRSLMTFLTLRPGDTDAEYFDGYTEEQMDFCRSHGEALMLYVEECWLGGRK